VVQPRKCLNIKPRVTLEACHRLALSEGQKEDKRCKEMKGRLRKIVLLTLPIGPVLIFLGICFPWFFFAGTAQYRWGTIEVSGWVSAVGIGELDGAGAEVTMWSSPTQWSSAESDFWYGYLDIAALVLVVASVLVLMKADTRISMLLALVVFLMVFSAFLMATVYYEPYIFVITGQIDAIPGVYAARLYSTQATVTSGSGLWLSFIGGILSMISIFSNGHLRNLRR